MSDLPVLLSPNGEPVTLTTAEHLLRAAGIEDVQAADTEQLAAFLDGMKHWTALTREAQGVVNDEVVSRRDRRASGTWSAGEFKVTVPSKTAGTVTYDGDALGPALVALAEAGVIDHEAQFEACEWFYPAPYWKVKQRGVDGLLKLGGEVQAAIEACRTVAPEPPTRKAKVTRIPSPVPANSTAAFIVPRCECSHATGDHTHTQTGGIAVLRGACMVQGCECREFREQEAEAA